MKSDMRNSIATIRQWAESQLKSDPSDGSHPGSQPDILQYIRELEVHQTRLEEENTALKRAAGAVDNPAGEVTMGNLEQRDDRYRSLFRKNHSVMLLIDPETGEIRDANLAACDYYGWPHAELCSKNIAEINVLPQTEVAAEMQKAKNEKREHYFFRHRLASGEVRDVEVYAGPIKFGGSMMLYSLVHDITDQKIADDEIRDKKNLLSNLLVNLQEGVLLEDSNRKIVLTNQLFCDMFGIPAPPDVLVGADCTESAEQSKMLFNNPDEFIARIALILEQKIAVFNDQLELADGRHFERDYIPTYIGRVYSGHLWKYRDITQRRQTENALNESEFKYRNLVENINDVIYEVDDKGVLKYISSSIEKIIGYTVQELLGRSFDQFVGVNAVNLRNRLGILAEQKDLENEYELITKSGQSCWIRLSTKAIFRDGVFAGGSGVLTDITERKLAEFELLKFRTVSDQANYGNAIADLDGTMTYVNDSFAAMHGMEPGEMVGKSIMSLHNEEQKTRASSLMDVLKTKGGFSVEELWRTRKDGSVFPTLMSASMVYDSKSNPLFVASTTIDITNIKASEESLKQREEALNYAQKIGHMGSWEYDLISGKLTGSDNYYRLLGLNPHEHKDKLYEWFVSVLHPEDAGTVHKLKHDGYRENETKVENLRVILPGGELKWLQNVVVPVFKGTDVVGLKGVNIDITEKKFAEEEIAEQSARSTAIIAAMPDLIFVINKEGVYTEFYYSGPKELPVTADQIEGTNLKSFFSKEQAERYLQHINDCLRLKKLVTLEYEISEESGLRQYEARLTPYGKDHTLSFVRDITRRKEAEEEIRQLNHNLELKIAERTAQLAEANAILLVEIEERLQAKNALFVEKQRLADIIEGTNLGTWEWNVQTGETIFNDRWAEIIGYTLEEISPISIETWMKFAHPDDLKLSGELLEKHFKGDSATYEFESRMKHKRGDWVWVLDRGKVHTWDTDGTPLLMSGTHQEITDRKRAAKFETELLELSVQLSGLPNAEISAALDMALSRIGIFLDADRAYIFEMDLADNTMSNTFEWCKEGIAAEKENLKDLPCDHLPRWLEKMQQQENVVIPSVQDLPETWRTERDVLGAQGIQSLIAIPIHIENSLAGFVGLDSVSSLRQYSVSEINMLKVWSNLLSSLLSHQRKEMQIEQTRGNYETFFNTIDDFLFVLDEKGNMIHTNTAVTKRLGYSSGELMDKHVLMVHPPERREEAGRIVGEMLAGTAEFCPVPLMTKSAGLIPVETRVKAGSWDGRPVIFGVSKDMTKIQLSEEKFSKAFHTNAALMAISSIAEGKFIEVNETMVKTLGYSREELIGKRSGDIGLFDDRGVRDALVENLKRNIPVKEMEIVARTKSGVAIHGLFSAGLIDIGKDACMLTMMIDITERKRIEEDLMTARIEADKANRAKSEFISRMSHELRTPMNSILGFAQLMGMGDLPPAHRKGVNHILNSGHHLLRLINEVLDISRIEAGHLLLTYEPVELSGIIREMIDVLHPYAKERNQEICLEVSPANNLVVRADRQRLRQVLLNLMNNAVKYNREGGSVIIRTLLEKKKSPGISTVKITVSDTGPGIREEELGKLFLPFERIGAEKTGIEGTGLGLALAKELVDAMGGRIGVESVPGKGSTFWIEIQYNEDQLTAENQAGEPSAPGTVSVGKSGTVLYIEDNASAAELVGGIVRDLRPAIHFITTRFGKLAVKLAHQSRPDLILLDLNLPDSYGLEVLATLRADAALKSIPVVIVSADATPARVSMLKKFGAEDYLTKPIDIIMFLQVVDKWLGKSNVDPSVIKSDK